VDERGLIRSYQRIFRPERRLYQVEGRSLPVPGGVPLRWLAWASGALLCVLVLSSGSALVALLAGCFAGIGGLALGGRAAALLAAALAALAVPVAGFLLSLIGWPLRFVVLPGLVATLATQATPDGRRADRFALSWLAVRLAPRRRSLGRALHPVGRGWAPDVRLWVAADERGPRLRRARLRGPATVSLAGRASIFARRFPRRTLIRPLGRGRRRRAIVDSVELAGGELAEVRP
jgi:hypothetical protein